MYLDTCIYKDISISKKGVKGSILFEEKKEREETTHRAASSSPPVPPPSKCDDLQMYAIRIHEETNKKKKFRATICLLATPHRYRVMISPAFSSNADEAVTPMSSPATEASSIEVDLSCL